MQPDIISNNMATIGDILEFRTSRGFVYAQYTHKVSPYGALIRVFSKAYRVRPSNLIDVVSDKVQFATFYALNSVLRQKLIERVGNAPVSPVNQKLPIFRNNLDCPLQGRAKVWYFWDGVKEWKVGEITEEQRKYPVLGVCGTELVIERIETGWRAENDRL